MMADISAGDLHTLTIDIIDIAIPAGVSYQPTAIHLPNDATAAQRAQAVSIIAGLKSMPMVVAIENVAATAGTGDTAIQFDAWDNEGSLAFSRSIDVIDGVAVFAELADAIPGTYKVRAYGETSLTSNYVEVVAT